jgi:hypothetical protein
MPRVGFDPMISVFKRAKTFRTVDSAVTVIGSLLNFTSKIHYDIKKGNSFETTQTCIASVVYVHMDLISTACKQ